MIVIDKNKFVFKKRKFLLKQHLNKNIFLLVWLRSRLWIGVLSPTEYVAPLVYGHYDKNILNLYSPSARPVKFTLVKKRKFPLLVT